MRVAVWVACALVPWLALIAASNSLEALYQQQKTIATCEELNK